MERIAAGLLLLLNACTLSTEPDLGGMPIHTVRIAGELTLTPRQEVRDDTLRVFLDIRNRGQGLATMESGVCSFAIRGVGAPGVAWDNRLPPGAACIDLGVVLNLETGQHHERLVYRRALRQLREIWPAGRYTVSLFYREGSSLRRLTVGTVRL